MKVPIDRIIAKFEQIQENIRLILEHLPDNIGDFMNLGLIKDGIYKRFEYSVELVLDISAMVNTYYNFGIPNNSVEIINNLKAHSVISPSLCDKIQEMRAFRNVLVQIYEKLDDFLAYRNIRESIGIFTEIQEAIMNFLKKNSPSI